MHTCVHMSWWACGIREQCFGCQLSSSTLFWVKVTHVRQSAQSSLAVPKLLGNSFSCLSSLFFLGMEVGRALQPVAVWTQDSSLRLTQAPGYGTLVFAGRLHRSQTRLLSIVQVTCLNGMLLCGGGKHLQSSGPPASAHLHWWSLLVFSSLLLLPFKG